MNLTTYIFSMLFLELLALQDNKEQFHNQIHIYSFKIRKLG